MTRRIALLAILAASGCTRSDEPAAIRLVDVFEESMVSGGTPPAPVPPRKHRTMGKPAPDRADLMGRVAHRGPALD